MKRESNIVGPNVPVFAVGGRVVFRKTMSAGSSLGDDQVISAGQTARITSVIPQFTVRVDSDPKIVVSLSVCNVSKILEKL